MTAAPTERIGQPGKRVFQRANAFAWQTNAFSR
jgi:hypothetical protein